MDGFLTKPIEIERLRDALTKFGLSAGEATPTAALETSAQPEPAETTPPPINLARLNEITDGDAEFAKELIDTFIASSEAQMVELHAAINTSDRDTLMRIAHKLKGACANIHAEEMRALVSRLEAEALTASEAELHACNALLQLAFVRTKGFLQDPSVFPAQVKAAS
jgi:two-component system, sensor histidine kinase and response regulator